MNDQNNVIAIGLNPFDGLTDAAGGAAEDFLNAVGASFCEMAADLSSSVFGFAAQRTALDLNASYIVENYNVVFAVSILLLVGLFLCSAIMGALRGDPHIITRSVVATGTAIIGSFIALGLLQMVLDASDGLAEAFGDDLVLGADLVQLLQQLPERENFALSMTMSLLVAIFSFALFIVLFIRKIAIIALAVFIPLYLAGQGAVTSQNWMRRAGEMMAALIFVKPAIYAIFTLGASIALDAKGSAANQTLAILTAVALMIAAILSPFALFRIIGFADTQLIKSVGDSGRRGAASFGKGAGAMLGGTSRETFRGIGARMQTRGRGAIGADLGGGVGIGADVGGGPVPAFAGRPSVRPARGPGAPTRTSTRTATTTGAGTDTGTGGVGATATRTGAPHVRTGKVTGAPTGAAAGGGAERVRATAPRVGATAAPGSSATTAAAAARPNPPRHVRTATAVPPSRPGGNGR